jgi:hypothetical protein
MLHDRLSRHTCADMIAMNYKFSGHETFPCRYAWLPKAYAALKVNERVFADEDGAMIALGVGKNMARAIRFWVQAAGIAEPAAGGFKGTTFGNAVFGKHGLDPFLEDIRTLRTVHSWAWHNRLTKILSVKPSQPPVPEDRTQASSIR